MPRKNTPTTRVDLWLSQADLDHLNNLTNRWQVSRQRIIEQAVAYTATAGTQPVEPTTKYEPQTRVILNLDSITLAQLDQIAPKRTPALRAALGAFAIN